MLAGASLFLSTLSLRRATDNLDRFVTYLSDISIHALLAESDWEDAPFDVLYAISIHALLAESDLPCAGISAGRKHNFYPRSPCGERQLPPRRAIRYKIFLSTLSLRRATSKRAHVEIFFNISIHALLAESDRISILDGCQGDISIHALLAESDIMGTAPSATELIFLSTLSLRRATLDAGDLLGVRQHFYPRSPCGERRYGLWTPTSDATIFLSTLSLRRATWPPLPR